MIIAIVINIDCFHAHDELGMWRGLYKLATMHVTICYNENGMLRLSMFLDLLLNHRKNYEGR